MGALQGAAAVAAVLLGLATAVGILYGAQQRTRTYALREDVNDRDKRIVFIEAERDRALTAVQQKDELVGHLREELRVLRANWHGAQGPIGDIRRRVVLMHDQQLPAIEAGIGELLEPKDGT